MANIEELPPQPFLGLLNKIGLPTHIREGETDKPVSFS